MKRPDADVTAQAVTAPGSFLSDESVYTKASKSKQAEKFTRHSGMVKYLKVNLQVKQIWL